MSAPYFQSFFRRARIARLATALAMAGAVGVSYAQQGQQQQKSHTVGEKTSEAFQKLKPLQDAQNWDGMIALLDSIPNVKPGSYDEALILDMKAKLYIQKNELSKGIVPWERALQLSEQHGYFPERQMLDMIFFLAQLYAQEGSTSKVPAQQQQHFAKSLSYFRRYMEKTPNPTPEALMTFASILYYKATGDENNIDRGLLKEARAIIDRGLMSSLKPKEGFYQLQLAILQQQGDTAGSAELVEFILKQTPTKKDMWQMLVALYLQLSENEKEKAKAANLPEPQAARDYLVRAIATYERAQALGFLNAPKDNMNLVSLYLMANQFTKGTEILYNGMKAGKIESEPNNWRVLGRYYQEANMDKQAIKVLEEATTLFPKHGEIEVQIAQIYLQKEMNREALRHAQRAIEKGNFESTKPYSVHYLIAYTAYDLGELDVAVKAIEAAEKFKEAADDQQLPKLKNVIMEAIAERDAKNNKDKENTEQPKKTASVR